MEEAMILSRRSDYGLQAALELARLYGVGFLSARQIAEQHRLPLAFVKKLLQTLARADLVRATVGSRGGYALARAPREISVRRVLEALEGTLAPVSCLSSETHCKLAADCPNRVLWDYLNRKIQDTLESVSLQDALRWIQKNGVTYG
jgi:Rrf2 family protein